MYRFAWLLTSSVADAEDITQECFLALIRRPASFDPSRAQLRVLILAFWATWCVPCKAELAELNRFWSRVEENPHVALLTVSIDDTMTAVAEFATQNGYRVPILKSDGTIESAYTNGKAVGADGAQIPQLYILDAMGNVRFHLTGFGNDGLFVQKLGWMIAAALK